jgi:hypothetical protein
MADPSYMPIAPYLDLRIPRRLQMFHLRVPLTISVEDPQVADVLADISDAFSAITDSNVVRRISLDFDIVADNLFNPALLQGWGRLAREISRLSSGGALSVGIHMCIAGRDLDCREPEGRRELYDTIKAQMDEVWGNEPHVNASFTSNGVPGVDC